MTVGCEISILTRYLMPMLLDHRGRVVMDVQDLMLQGLMFL